MLAIIDYGMGNLRSVQKGFEKVGYPAEIITKPQQLADCRGVVLPGVGAFADAMDNLTKLGFVQPLKEIALTKPLLGICLGQQLLFQSSEEWGETPGLGIFPGKVRRFKDSGLKVPHMGWNQINIQKSSPLLAGVPENSAFYFVHSYYVDPADHQLIITTTDYGQTFASIVGRGNVFGIQFHPEKSSAYGLKILQNFGKLVEKC